MGSKQKVTIYDLARRLGTTASTVSRALQNNPRISQKTRDAVLALARELNYFPDPIAHHLRTGRGNVLGIIVPRIDRNFFATIISAFQNIAQQEGYQIIIAASDEKANDESAALDAMIQKKVDGIAISLSVNTPGDNNYAERCEAARIPLVYFDRLPDDYQNFDTVSNDNYQIGYDAAIQLIRRGCKKLGHLAGPSTRREYIERFEGFKQAVLDKGLEFNPDWVLPAITNESGYAAALKIQQMKNRPDGIFAAGDYSAIACMDTLQRKGIRIPQDLAMIGTANEPFDAYLATPLASFDLHRHHIGEKTAEMLISLIKEAEAHSKEDDIDGMTHEPEHFIVNHDLILRDSAV